MGFPVPVKTDDHWFNTSQWPAAAYPISAAEAGGAILGSRYANSAHDPAIQTFYRVSFDLEEASRHAECVLAANPAELHARLNAYYGCPPGFSLLERALVLTPKVDVERQWVTDGLSDILGIQQYPVLAQGGTLDERLDDIMQAVDLKGKVILPHVPRLNLERNSKRPDPNTVVFINSERTTVIRGMYVLEPHGAQGGCMTYDPGRAVTLAKLKHTTRKRMDARACSRSLSQITEHMLTVYFDYLWTKDYYLFNANPRMTSYLTRTISTVIHNIHTAEHIALERGLASRLLPKVRKDILDLCYYANSLEKKETGFVSSWLTPRLKRIKAPDAYWKLVQRWVKKPGKPVKS